MADDVKVLIKAILDDKQFKAGVAGMGTAAKKSSSGIVGGFRKIKGSALAIIAAIGAAVAVLGKVIKVAKDFEKAIADVASVSTAAREELSLLARDAAVKTKFEATETARALKILALAGLDTVDMAKTLVPALNLATAANIGIEESVDILVAQLKTFGIEASNSIEVVDILTKTTISSNTNMTELGFALKFAGAAAKSVGASFEDTNAILGTLADRGIKGTLAGTQLRAAFAALLKPTSEARDILNSYGISIDEVKKLLPTPIELFKRLRDANLTNADALAIFGRRQSGISLLIREGIPDLEKLRDKIGEAGGAAETAANVQLDTLDGQLALLKSAWQELVLTLTGAGGVTGSLKEVVTRVKDVVREFTEFLKTEEGVKRVATAIAVVKTAFIALWTIFKTLNTPLIAFVEGLAVAFRELGEIIAAVKEGSIGGIRDAFARFGSGGIRVLTKVRDRFIKAGKDIKDATFDIGEAWNEAADKINNASQVVKESTQAVGNEIKTVGEETQGEIIELAELTPEILKLIDEAVKVSEEERLMAKINALQRFTEENELAAEDLKRVEEAITAFRELQFQARIKQNTKFLMSTLTTSKRIFTDAKSLAGSLVDIQRSKLSRMDQNDKAALERQKRKIRAFAIAEKAISITQSTIATILAAVKTYRDTPGGPITRGIAAGVAAAAGAARTAAIAATPIPTLQEGGRLGGGRTALVGEVGPELFTPDQPGNVFSNRVVKGLTFGQSGISEVQGPTTVTEDNSQITNQFIFNGIRDISEARNELIQLEGEAAF